jgi:hypothetical protein
MRNFWYIPAAVVFVLAIVGFFAGWLQLSLGPDTWGVVFIASRGFERDAVDPAGFSWRWQRLLPRSLTLYKIPLGIVKADLTVKTALASGEAYSSLVSDRPDFSIQATVSVLYRIRPEALPTLVEKDNLRQETLTNWHQLLQAGIQQQAIELALRIAGGPTGSGGDLPDARGFADAVARELPGKFPQVQFIAVVPVVVRMPDPDLYAKLKRAYLRMVEQKDAALSAMAPRLAADEAAQRSALQRQEVSIALLTRYGELFNRYPSLIKFLVLARAEKLTPKAILELDLLDKLPLVE